MWYGQFVIGPPGSGKTTYCQGMQQMFEILHRKHAIINLDPANDDLPYKCSIDIRKLINFNDVMQNLQLGPNGALMYCIDYLVENFDWLTEKLLKSPDTYLIFDCPGQVELYCHHEGMLKILQRLQRMDARLTAVHLVDSTLCADPVKYVSALIVSLSGQIQLELPHVNVLTKIDLLKYFANDLAFKIEYYADGSELIHLLNSMDTPYNEKYATFNEVLCELIEDFNLISFRLLDIQNKDIVLNLLKEIDTANGFSLGSIQSDLGIFNISINVLDDFGDKFGDIQENYIDLDDVEDSEKSNT